MDTSRLMLNILFGLVTKRLILPNCLMLSNVTIEGSIMNPSKGGGYADVWEGRMGGIHVAIKVLRKFEELQDLRHVSLRLG